MIAIDTNVLLRYLLADDTDQYRKAKILMTSQAPVLITDVVLIEAIWTLAGKRYNLDKLSICNVVRSLVGDSVFVFEDSQVVWSSLCDYQESKKVRGKVLDFADAFIVNKSYSVAEKMGLKLMDFYSFDKAVSQLRGTNSP